MKKIRISDMTMKQTAEGFSLSFKEKIELSKLLDRLGVDLIELEGIVSNRIDGLRIKSIAAAVQDSTIAVPVQPGEDIAIVWNSLQTARHPRLQVVAPVSAVQMEYLFHKKPEAMLTSIESTIAACKAVCADVEFIAEDATRSEPAFLTKVLKTAIAAGATTITLCDTAGTMLPTEFVAFLQAQYQNVPELKAVTLGISSVNTLSMADACAIAAITAGAGEIKAATYPLGSASLGNIARLLSAKSDALGASCGIHTTQLSRTAEQIAWLCQSGKTKAATQSVAQEDDIYLSAHDDQTAIANTARQLGYDLSEEDIAKVYDAFLQIAQKKERVSAKELDAIIASAAMQVPATYQLDTYVVTSGNSISATAHIRLTKNGQMMEGVCMGDGSIDAAFTAIEKITGCHYELDDFQLQAVTEGREAMGQTVVKLRSGGKVYSGRGISTDIVGAGIRAYLSALNKIVYEEEA